ncbi:MAG: transposase zinc-binding domain-containing protein [Deltaproteobacteria bacterium]|nr:transposase zinc-binding domain-containing protein [Deltaproteobacteria bacterium]
MRAYFRCGDLTQGFARVRCPDCHHEYLLALFCRGRWFCPSCHCLIVISNACYNTNLAYILFGSERKSGI